MIGLVVGWFLDGVVVASLFIALLRYGTMWAHCDPDTWYMRRFCKSKNLKIAESWKMNSIHPKVGVLALNTPGWCPLHVKPAVAIETFASHRVYFTKQAKYMCRYFRNKYFARCEDCFKPDTLGSDVPEGTKPPKPYFARCEDCFKPDTKPPKPTQWEINDAKLMDARRNFAF